VRKPRWQLQACGGSAIIMKLRSALPAFALALTLCAPAGAVPGGEIGTLEKGLYVCEIPGEDIGPARLHVPSEDFTVITSSSYRVEGKRGSYLLTGDNVVMTSGPFRGKRYHRLSHGLLRHVDDKGENTSLRCVHTNRSYD